jgi:hypothetical protein
MYGDSNKEILPKTFFTFDTKIFLLEKPSFVSKSIDIPFNFPFELKFHPEYSKTGNFQNNNSLSSNVPLQIAPSINFKISDSKEISISTFQTKNHFDSAYFERDTNTRLPSLWQLNSAQTNSNSGVAFSFLKKNFSFYADLSARFLGLESGHSMLDSVSSNIGFQYRLDNQKSSLYRLSYIAQFTNSQMSDERIFNKRLELYKKSQFFSQGFTLSTKSAMFEGLIRLPTQLQTSYEIDGQWRPEVQGRLGIKWFLPDYMKP